MVEEQSARFDVVGSPKSVRVTLDEIFDVSPFTDSAAHFVNAVFDVGSNRLRLKVHTDGFFTLELYDPESYTEGRTYARGNVNDRSMKITRLEPKE